MSAASPSRRFGALIVLVGAVAVLGSLSTCSREEVPTKKREANTKAVVIPVEGMSCVACAVRVKKALLSLDGVSDIEVNLGDRNARVCFDPSRLSPERLVSTINGLGYHAGAPAEVKR